MFDMGFVELFVIAVIGLLVLGPERLPQVIKKLASFVTKSRYLANNLKEEFEREANLSEMRESLNRQKAELQNEVQGLSKDFTQNESESEGEKGQGEQKSVHDKPSKQVEQDDSHDSK
jgi:sec-independent protein translocase protein TatB